MKTIVALLALALVAAPARAALEASDTVWDGGEAPKGVYFHWYEPSFYTGFAPRTQEPERLHIELSRGQQVRVTLVVGPEQLDVYLDDLLARRQVYQELIDGRIIELTTNKEWERFVARLGEVGVAEAAKGKGKGKGSPEAYRQKSLELMTKLNPERVFRISIPLDRLLPAWHARLAALAPDASTAQKLDAANALLPGRLALHDLGPELDAALAKAVDQAHTGKPDAPAFRDQAVAFLERASGGRYAVRDEAVEAIEFTAIYPAGTVDATTTYKGEKLPDFGVTGVWPLIRRQHGEGILGMVDYLSPNPGYGFISMLPYQYAGGITYNAFHNAGVRCGLGETPFLPSAWRRAMGERDPKKAYQNLWIVSRGPTSHGCTRLASGHMSELRQIVPTDSEVLERVATFRNLPGCYDVFDIAGDGRPRVMGVQYYLAYKSHEHTPVKAYVSNRREPFYRWLYGTNVNYGDVGHVALKDVPVCRFVGKKAEEAEVLRDVPLYEATFAPEPIQFYHTKPVAFDSARGFEFNRELRKVGHGHTLDRAKLFFK